MKKKLFLFLIGFICVTTLLSGCQKKNIDPIETQEDHQKKQPVIGGEIIVPIIRFHTLNPIVNDNESVYHLNKLVYDGLVELDSNFKPIPALAKKWEILKDGSEIIFDLRNNVTWHDGAPFTAMDVKFTIDALKLGGKEGRKTIYSNYAKNIESVEVIDSLKVSIKLNTNSRGFIEEFAFPIIPKHEFINGGEVYNKINTPIVGTGPFKINAYDRYSQFELVSNDDYWKEKPYIERIVAKIVPDKEAAITSMTANEINLAKAQDYDWEKFAGDKSLNIYEFTTQEYEFLGFNLQNEFLNDINIRNAIAYAIDRHKITNEVYLGHSTVTDVPVHPNSYLYNEEAQRIGFSEEKAQEFLKNSNWKNENVDILENEEGEKLRFNLLVNNDNPERLKASEMIANQLRAIGIDIMIESVSWEEYEKKVSNRKFDLLFGGWQMSRTPDLSFLLHSNYISSTNLSGYSDPTMDALLDQVKGPISHEMRLKKYMEIQNKFVKDLPYISLFYKNSALIVNKEIKGDISPNYNNLYYGIGDWYVMEE